jgi:hypothetical protein
MDDIASEKLGIPLAERLRTYGFNLATSLLRYAGPEDIVLATGIDAEHCPHIRRLCSMIVINGPQTTLRIVSSSEL